MKHKLKTVLLVTLGIIIGTSITVCAYSYSSKDISFTSANENFKAENVEDAINQLYDLNTSCISGNLNHEKNTNWNIDFGFMPSKFIFSYKNGNGRSDIIYDKNFSENIYLTVYNNLNMADWTSYFTLSGSNLKSSFLTSAKTYTDQYTLYYVACK